MIGAGAGGNVRERTAAILQVPVLWVEGSTWLLGHPGCPFFEQLARFSRARVFSLSGAQPPNPQPVDAAGPVEISGEAGDSHWPLENAGEAGVSHERPQALLRAFYRAEQKKQDSRAKAIEGIGADAP